MRRPQLEDELMLGAEIELLQVLALVQVPEVQLVPVLPAEQHLGHEAVLEGSRQSPLARHHGVVAEVPPAVIGELLRSAVDLPASERLEVLGIYDEDAARRLSL